MSSFLKSGFTHFDSRATEIEAAQAEREKNQGLWRFWLKEDESANVIFLTGLADGEDIPVVEEHNLKLNGKWGNHFTCLKTVGQTCPLCEAGDRAQLMGFLLVIDRREFKGKNDKVYKDNLKVYPATFGVLKTIKKLASKSEQGIKGVEFEITRNGKKGPRCGDNFDREAEHTGAAVKALLGTAAEPKSLKDALGKESVLAYWEEYLACKPAGELATLVSQKQSGTGAAAATGLKDSEEVNFDD